MLKEINYAYEVTEYNTFDHMPSKLFPTGNNELHNSAGIIELPGRGCPTGTVPIRRTSNGSSNSKQKYRNLADGGKTYVRSKFTNL